MKTLRRAVVAAAALVIGVGGLAVPAQAASPPAAPVAPNLTAPKPHEVVPKSTSGDQVVYVDGPAPDALRRAAAAAGGKVVAARPDRAEIAVPAGKIDTLAKQPGVTDVRNPDRAIPMSSQIDAEGIGAANVNAWNTAGGKKGDNVKVGILDVGFQDVDGEQVGTPVTHFGSCADGGLTSTHGTSVAEVVHAMAPNAQLFLACAGTSMEFGQAATWLKDQGVQVITAAVGFLTSGRGDGTGVPGSPADVVRTTSQAGILWSAAAGNLAQKHYSGTAATAADGFVRYGGTTSESNSITARAGATITVGARWDAWPKTQDEFDLYVTTSSTAPTSPNDPSVVTFKSNGQHGVPGGAEPTVETTVTAPPGASGTTYYVYLKNIGASQADRLDVFVDGTDNSLGFHNSDGSVTEPATSPYVVAVGEAQAIGGTQVESESGRGPTVDGRRKPDLTGWDRVSTTDLDNHTFSGTSAAAANVAGAAALLKSQYPTLDVTGLENELYARVSPVKADNDWGHGGLSVGSPTAAPAGAGSGYTPFEPSQRVNAGFKVANSTSQTTFSGLPADATAVEATVTVRTAAEQNPNGVDLPSEIDVLPAGAAGAGGRPVAVPAALGGGFTSVNMILTLGNSLNGNAVQVHVGGGAVWSTLDVRGYFSLSGGSSYFPLQAPARALDTRGLAGSPKAGAFNAGDDYALTVGGKNGVPVGATAVAVDVTTLESTGEPAIDAYGNVDGPTTLITGHPATRRTTSAIVAVGQNGVIHLKDDEGGQTQLIVDVTGYFGSGTGQRYVPLPAPVRVGDTATGTGAGGRVGPLGAGEAASFQVGGQAGIPASATGVVLSTTGRDDNADTELSVYPHESGYSPVTAVALKQGETEPTTTLTGLGSSGLVDVRSEHGQASAGLDAWGYFTGGTQVPAAATDCAAPVGEAGYTAAFDGRAESGLDGWQSTGTKATQNGCVLQTGAGNDVTWYALHNLRNDYTLKLDWKTPTQGADSSVLVGFADPGTDSSAPGSLAVRIAPNGTGTQGTGSIAGLKAAGNLGTLVKPLGQWNTYEITLAWNEITVSLNGTTINQYITANPSALAENTYIGVRNSGTADPVQYRDIRIRRNEPVSSGAVVQGSPSGGYCLDLANDDINALNLWTYECNGTPAQVFTRPGDGTLAVAGRCVDASDGGGAVGLANCNGTIAQDWVQRDDGSLISPATGLCLTASNPTGHAQLSRQNCDGGAGATQHWFPPKQHGVAGQLTGLGGFCLDLPGNDPTQDSAFMHECNRTPAQEWLAIGDGTLRVAGKCLATGGAADGTVAVGTGIPQLACVPGAPAQQWVRRADGTVWNPVSGLCLTAAGAANGAGVTDEVCGGDQAAGQQWHLSAQTQVRGSIVGIGGKCADVKGNDPNSDTVWLWTCYGPAGQFWNTNGDGTFQAFGKCLDAAGTGVASVAKLEPCNSGSTTQQWATQPDGYLVNAGTQLVLDDQFGATGDGNELQIYSANGGPFQKWSTPLRAE